MDRPAREQALAEIRGEQQKSQAKVIASILTELASNNAKALSARAKVNAADAAQAEAAQADAGQPIDITQFFQPTQINPNDPIGSLQALGISPGGAIDLSGGPGGARGGALANRAVAGARQAAGTAPSPQGGGVQQPSVTIGGETITGPEEIRTVRETTGPFEFDAGFYAPATTREVTIQPNVITAGDILQAKLRQEEAAKDRALLYGKAVLAHALETNRARVGMTSELIRATNAPIDVAMAASDAYLSSNDAVAQKLLAPYDTAGASGIAAERMRARLLEAQAREAEQALGLGAGSLYDPAVYLGLPPNPKPLTGAEAANILTSAQDEFTNVFKSGVTTEESAARLENLGLRLSKVGQMLVFPEPGETSFGQTGLIGAIGGFFRGQKRTAVHLPATTLFPLMFAAVGDVQVPGIDASGGLVPGAGGNLSPEQVQGAREALVALGLATKEGEEYKLGVAPDPRLQPWVDRVWQGANNHTDDTLDLLYARDREAVEGIIGSYLGGE